MLWLRHFLTKFSNLWKEGYRSLKVSVQRNVSVHTLRVFKQARKSLCNGKRVLRKLSTLFVTVLCSTHLLSFCITLACTAHSFHSFSCNLFKHLDEEMFQRTPLIFVTRNLTSQFLWDINQLLSHGKIQTILWHTVKWDYSYHTMSQTVHKKWDKQAPLLPTTNTLLTPLSSACSWQFQQHLSENKARKDHCDLEG